MMAVQANLLSSHSVKTLGAMKAERTVKRITFNSTEANPGNNLYVSVPKLNEDEVIVPGTLTVLFNIDLTGGHANNYLVQNVSRALVDRFVVKYAGTTVQGTNGYDIYEIFQDLFLSTDEREEKILEDIQSTNLNMTRSGAVDKPTSEVDAENKVSVTVNGSPYRVYNAGITGIDIWRDASRFFGTKSCGRPNMNLTRYLTGNKVGLFNDLRSMADTTMHGNGQRLVNTQDGVQLAIERNTTGSGTVKCHIFSISDSQMNIMNKQLQTVQY